MAIEMAILMAMASYSVAEAKNNLPKLLDLALKGEEVVITRRGQPIADLTRHKAKSGKIDVEWLRQNMIKPKDDAPFNSADLIRQMRDEGY
jgi:antitoxin (DNA-binding transcriptional repressor) of toxin-antitoxin stability system